MYTCGCFYAVSSHSELLNELYESLTKKYGSVSIASRDLLSYLGMQVSTQSDGYILVSQPGYVTLLYQIFLLEKRSHVLTPMIAIELP